MPSATRRSFVPVCRRGLCRSLRPGASPSASSVGERDVNCSRWAWPYPWDRASLAGSLGRVSVLLLIAYYLSLAVAMLWCAAQVISAALGVWALIDSALRPAQYYAAADKRSKNFWVAVNAVAAVVGTFLAYQALLAVYIAGASTGVSFIGLLAVVASAVYLADVRPALQALAPVRVRSSIRIPGRASQRRPGRGRGPRDWSPGR